MVTGIRKSSGQTKTGVNPKGKITSKVRQAAGVRKKAVTLPPRVTAGKAGKKKAAPLSRKKAIEAAKKAAALTQQRWIIGGALLSVIVIGWFIFSPARKEAPPSPSTVGPAETKGGLSPQPLAPVASPEAEVPKKQLAFIRAVRLQPAQPTRMDILKVKVEVAENAPETLVYTYRWKVNDLTVEDASGDTLNLLPFKMRDLITVTVTPNDGDTAGFAVDSPPVAIHSVSPSLELKPMRKARKSGEPIELQLVSIAPDSDKVTFSLEDPHVPGMTIDKNSGKIIWRLQAGQKGSFSFGAAVEDNNRTKVTKKFDITV